MSILKKLKEKKFPILVSLPKNSVELAYAAFDAGADGIKVHLNAHHRASGNTFGTFSEEKKFLSELSKIPCSRAVMIGGEVLPSAQEMEELSKLGFECFNLYSKFAQPYLFESKLKPMLAVDHEFKDADLVKLSEMQNAVVEASVVNPKDYGTALNEVDLAAYEMVVQRTKLPVVVPSQKKVLTSDLKKLKKVGVHGLLIGVIVTGDTEESIFRATREFVEERDALWP